jgi:hypothetical protein
MDKPENNGDKRNPDGTFGIGNKGKPAGAVTKVSVKVKESIHAFMEKNVEKIQESFDQLSAKEKLDFIAQLMSYTIPKLSATQIEAEHSGGITIRFEEPEEYKRLYPSQDQGNIGDLDGDKQGE